VERVNTAVVEGPARQYGDEPWLIAQQTGVPVFVGRTRSAAGRLAESTLVGTGGVGHVHLLDDAMQHRGLARDAEIVLLHRSDFQATLLPAGRLREPMAALERADFVVLREEDATLAARARRWMHPDAQIWMIRRELKLPAVPGPAVIFCAIAHPEEFVEGVQAQGVRIAARHAWRDHHRYTDRDVAKLFAVAAKHRAACYLTTAKDAVRLTDAQRARLEGIGPLLVVELTARLLDQETALVALEQCLARRRVRESAVVTPK
jgi:tetraacyldisaccharide 4'-kinase